MNILQVSQGSADWLAARAQHFCASDAAAAMGVSKFKTRSALLREQATGLTAEVDWATQERFDAGHAAEAAGLALAEQVIGDDLYPRVGTRVVEGLALLASFDGITPDNRVLWETKFYNAELAKAVANNTLEPHYWAQLEHQLLVSEAEIALFSTTDGTKERFVWAYYKSQPERRAQVIAAWKQFRDDLASYTPTPAAAPAPTGKAPETLPALHIEVTGKVTASNLAEFKATALAAISSVNRDLKTDADFADAEKAVKWCSDIESRLEAAKTHALSQTASIDDLFRAIDDISAEARRVRLDLDKLIKAEKDNRRTAIYQGGLKRFQDHIAALNARLGRPLMPVIAGVDFAGAIKGKRSLESMQDAVDTHLSTLKIAANEIADKIAINLAWLQERAADHMALFADVPQLVLKDAEAFAAIAQQRIDQHDAAEKAKAEAAAERERERIRAEEAAKLQREQDQRNRDEQARQQAEAIAKQAAAPVAAAMQEQATTGTSLVKMSVDESGSVVVKHVATVARAPAAPDPVRSAPSLRLGQISERLGFAVTADFLQGLGFEPAATDKRALLFHESDFPAICRALIEHIESAMEAVPA